MSKKKWNTLSSNEEALQEEKDISLERANDELSSIVHPQEPTKPDVQIRRGIVISISKGFVSISQNGFGTRIPYDATKHANLKKGDNIEF